jgi:Arc/MetJ-type ribon-helix-helix transcriptional regulator
MVYRQKVSVSIDSELLAFIDDLTNNRSEAINEALVQWRKQKLQAQVDEAYAQAASTQTEPDFGEENWLLNEQALQAEGID